jgi:hypothetical protein
VSFAVQFWSHLATLSKKARAVSSATYYGR